MLIHESRAELHATADDAGKRLDQFVVSRLEEVSRARVQQLIERKKIEVNGRAEKPSYRVQAGEVVRLLAPPTPRPLNAEPEDIPLDVLYEDEYLAVINKPADMVVHPAKGHWSGTLANAIQFRFGKLSQLNGAYRPGGTLPSGVPARQTSSTSLPSRLTRRELSGYFSVKPFRSARLTPL